MSILSPTSNYARCVILRHPPLFHHPVFIFTLAVLNILLHSDGSRLSSGVARVSTRCPLARTTWGQICAWPPSNLRWPTLLLGAMHARPCSIKFHLGLGGQTMPMVELRADLALFSFECELVQDSKPGRARGQVLPSSDCPANPDSRPPNTQCLSLSRPPCYCWRQRAMLRRAPDLFS